MSRLSLLKPVFALAVLTGCGVDQPVTESTSFEETNQSAIVLQNPGPQGVVGEVILETQLVASRAAGPDDRFDVTLSGASSAAEGTPAGLAIGFPSCGWWIAGTAQGVVESGQLSITVENVMSATEMGGAAFVYIDHDRDGICDASKGDEVFETAAAASGGNVSISTSALEPTDAWYCSFFNDYGA